MQKYKESIKQNSDLTVVSLYSVLKLNLNQLKMMSDFDIPAHYYRYIPMFEDYLQMRAAGEKKAYIILHLADKYQVSIAQLCIKYTLQLDTISIPKASSKEHIEDNAKLDFEISQEDMVELIKLNKIDYGEYAFWPVFHK